MREEKKTDYMSSFLKSMQLAESRNCSICQGKLYGGATLTIKAKRNEQHRNYDQADPNLSRYSYFLLLFSCNEDFVGMGGGQTIHVKLTEAAVNSAGFKESQESVAAELLNVTSSFTTDSLQTTEQFYHESSSLNQFLQWNPLNVFSFIFNGH